MRVCAVLLLLRRQTRKRPGQLLSLAVLTAVAALLLNIALMLSTEYLSGLSARAQADNSPDESMLVLPGLRADEIRAEVAARPELALAEVQDVHFAQVTFPFDGSDMSTLALVFDRDRPPTMGTRTDVAEAGEPVVNPIWAPALLMYSGEYATGDELTLFTPQGSETFHIQGFYEDLFGASTNMGALYFAVDGPRFADFDTPGFAPALSIGARAAEGADAFDELQGAVGEVQSRLGPGEPGVYVPWSANGVILTEGSPAIGANVFSVSFTSFALVIVLVTLVVMRFLIANLVIRDMTVTGVLRATGYTTGQIMAHVVLAFGGAASVASALGVVASYLVLPAVAGSLSAQSGVAWEPAFSLRAALPTVGMLTGAVCLFAAWGALRIRRVTTVAALRGGIATHSTRTDRLPLDRRRGPVDVLLGVKAMLQQPAQGVILGVTVTALTFASVFAVGMATNLLGDPVAFSRLVVGDVEDATVTVAPDADPDAVLADVRAVAGVDTAYAASWNGVMIGGEPFVISVVDDYDVWRHDPTYDGRLPRHANEISMGSSAARYLGLGVGDVYVVEHGTNSAEFLISGLTSSGRNLGHTIGFTTEGWLRVDPGYRPATVAAITTPGTDIAATVSALEDAVGDQAQSVVSGSESIRVLLGGYLTMVSVLATVVVSLTVLVVVLVIALVVTTMIVQSRTALGVKKALGFTTRDLTVQTLWTYVPIVAAAAVVGALAGWVGLNPLLSAALRSIGIMKVELALNPLFVAGMAAGVVALAVAVTLAASLRIGRVSAYALLSE